MKFLKSMSLLSKGLKYKSMIAFCLTSLIPLLICVWLVTTYIFPNASLFLNLSIGNISIILSISVIIALLGMHVTEQMIDPIVRMSEDAKNIADGDIDKVIKITVEDEVGDLCTSLNIMTQKIRDNIDELKSCGERTKLINMEINKKVLALSGLLQVGNLIAASEDLGKVLNFISQKIYNVESDFISFIMLFDRGTGGLKVVSSDNLQGEFGDFSLKLTDLTPHVHVIDAGNQGSGLGLKKIIEQFELENVIIAPIIICGKLYGILAMGNRETGFTFKPDQKEFLKVFAKQATIAVENDLLIKKSQELAILDELTGLYNQKYIYARLDEEIRRALMYQRPCGYLLIDIDGFKAIHEKLGEKRSEDILKATAEILRSSVTEVDKVARLEVDMFAIVLPEKNKKQSANIAESVRKNIEDRFFRASKISEKISVSVGVSENPIDGSSADELMQKAEAMLRSAKSLGKNRVAV